MHTLLASPLLVLDCLFDRISPAYIAANLYVYTSYIARLRPVHSIVSNYHKSVLSRILVHYSEMF